MPAVPLASVFAVPVYHHRGVPACRAAGPWARLLSLRKLKLSNELEHHGSEILDCPERVYGMTYDRVIHRSQGTLYNHYEAHSGSPHVPDW